MNKVPLLLIGDGPTEPTGLSRIARDLASLLSTDSSLPLDLVQIGGSVPPPFLGGWRHYPLVLGEDWGASCAARYWQDLFGSRPGILWTIWDPSRLLDYASLDLPVQRWTYTAIDSSNRNNQIRGPAGAALERFDRVLAYGRWASLQLKNSLPQAIDYLPHGLSLDLYSQGPSPEEAAWVASALGPYVGKALVLGCVATNQPRKDLPLFFGTLRLLRDRGLNVYGWLHTDKLVHYWAIPQLLEDFDLAKKVTLTGEGLSDRQLALLYQRCDLTLAPGLGEGFGYPIVESLAAGTPVIHGDFGGGAELVPKTEWRVPVRMIRLEGSYALERPVFAVEDWANAAERAIRWREAVGKDLCASYCRGQVSYLDWRTLWPRWRGWIRAGLDGK